MCAWPAATTSPKTPHPKQQPPFWMTSTYRLNDVPRWHESGAQSSVLGFWIAESAQAMRTTVSGLDMFAPVISWYFCTR